MSQIIVEVFELNEKSTQKDLENCIEFLQKSFKQRKVKDISVVVRLEIEQPQQYESFLNIYIENEKDQKLEKSNLNDSDSDEDNLANNFNLEKISKPEETQNKFEDNNSKEEQEQKNIEKPPLINLNQVEDQQTRNSNPFGFNPHFSKTQQKSANLQSSTKLSQISEKLAQSQIDKQQQEINIIQEKQDEDKINIEDTELQKLNVQAQQATQQKNYDEALNLYEKLQNLCIKDTDQNANIILQNYINIGACYMQLKQTQKAIDSFKQALEFSQQNPKSNKSILQIYQIYSGLGQCYNDFKQSDKTIEYWEQAIKYFKQAEDQANQEHQKNVGHILNNLGMAYFGNSDIKKAIYYFEQSVDLYKKVFGENDISVGNRMNNLAEAYRNNKEYEKALQLFEESLRIKKSHFQNENERSIANTLNNIGMTHQNLNQHSEAIIYFKQSLDIFKNLYGDNPKGDAAITMANVYNSIGESYRIIGNPEQACLNYQQAYELRKKIFGKDHKNTMHTSGFYAQMLFMTKKYDSSIEIFNEILEGQKKLYGEKSLQVGQTLNNLGTVLNQVKQYEKAINCMEKAIQIFEENV